MAVNQINNDDNTLPGLSGPHIFVAAAPTHIDVMAVTTSAETYTVPTNCRYIIMSANQDFYARKTGTAAIPAADVSDGTGSMLNPTNWAVTAGDTVSFIGSAAGTIITISAYA